MPDKTRLTSLLVDENVFALIRLPVSANILIRLKALGDIPKHKGQEGYIRQEGEWLIYEARPSAVAGNNISSPSMA